MLRVVECMFVQMVPLEVISENIAPHLSLHDLQALDTAFTNKYLRPIWADVLRSFRYACTECDTMQLSDVQWLHERGMTVTNISLCSSSASMHDAVNYICTHINTLRQLKLPEVYDQVCIDSVLQQLAYGCPQLEVLHILGADYICVGISALGQQCRNLHTVCLANNIFSDAGIRSMCSSCPNLLHIDISKSYYLTDSSLMSIADAYAHLESINIVYCNFTDDGLLYFADKCHELRSVSVTCNNITSRGLTALWAANPNLMDVDISGNDFTSDDDIIQLVQCCPLLQKLNMSYCNQITDAAVIAVAEHCPQLQFLDVTRCFDLSDASLIALGQHCHELKSINISWLNNLLHVCIAALVASCPLLQEFYAVDTSITDAGVIAVAEHCPQLKSLDVTRCFDLSDVSLIALGQHCHELKSIDISFLKNISDVGIAALAAGCPLLQEFYASKTNITDSGVIALARGCHDLRKIRLNYCKCISISAISTITENCPLLSEINICGGQVDDSWLYVIAQHCRNLTVLDVSLSGIVEADAVRAVLESCSRLTKIYARDCIKLRDKVSIRKLHKNYPHVSGLLDLS